MNYKDIIGKKVNVIIDRKKGSHHPQHKDIVYEVNYGYIQGIMGGDGEEQDAYVLGIDTPVSSFDGVVTAVINRLNDNEDKWIVVPEKFEITDEEIIRQTYFQEKYFKSRIIR